MCVWLNFYFSSTTQSASLMPTGGLPFQPRQHHAAHLGNLLEMKLKMPQSKVSGEPRSALRSQFVSLRPQSAKQRQIPRRQRLPRRLQRVICSNDSPLRCYRNESCKTGAGEGKGPDLLWPYSHCLEATWVLGRRSTRGSDSHHFHVGYRAKAGHIDICLDFRHSSWGAVQFVRGEKENPVGW